MPKDLLGNEIKVGDVVKADVVAHSVICKVMSVKQPSMLSTGPGKQGLQQVGEVVVLSEHHIPFTFEAPFIPGIVVCKLPPDGKGTA